MPLKAILLDFDGVIAEPTTITSPPGSGRSAVMGWQVADEVAARSAEIDDREFLGGAVRQRGIVSDKIDEWVRRKQVLTVQMLRDSPRLYPGVVELIRALQGRAKLAVVSGTWRENIQVVLEAAGLAGAFDTIVGKEDVTAVKPAAEAYQLALKRLRLSAQVGGRDRRFARRGWPSARAAGIRVIAVGHRRPFGDWVGDAAYVSGFEPVQGLLRHLGL